jgi:nitrate reductase gamma subunit
MPRPNGDHSRSNIVAVVVVVTLVYTCLLGLSLLYLRRAFLEDLRSAICVEAAVEGVIERLLPKLR